MVVAVEPSTDRLWGDIYLTKDRIFTRKQADRSLIAPLHFILNPLYKLYSHVLSEEWIWRMGM